MTIVAVVMATYLVFNCDLRSQSVVCVPLLCEGQAILRPLVLGLQVTVDFAGVCVRRAGGFEFLTSKDTHSEDYWTY